MFDIGATELLLTAIVAVIVIGPKDMPLAMRTAGRWIGKMRRLSGQFRSGIDAMVREAEMDDMEKKWKAQNAKIMRDYPQGSPTEMEPTGAYPPKAIEASSAETKPQAETAASVPAADAADTSAAASEADAAQPQVPDSEPKA